MGKGRKTKWIITDPDFYDAEQSTPGRTPKLSGYRVKEIRSGNILELEVYPYWDTRPKCGVKASRLRESRAAQKRYNERNSRKRFVRLVNENFGPGTAGGLHVTLTYESRNGRLPVMEEIQRDARNYIARWQRRRKKAGLASGKYMIVAEEGTENTKRLHLHVILESGIDRDTCESLWHFGYANADRLQPNEYGLEAMGQYLSKNPKGRRRWWGSKNLKQPTVKVYDHKVTRSTVRAIQHDKYEARELLKAYPGYFLYDPEQDVRVRTNSFVSGAYISIMLARDQRNDETKGRVKR